MRNAIIEVFPGGAGIPLFDPYPYILLNLVLSCMPRYRRPSSLMSQNRADAKRNALAEQDYRVNRRAEAENRVIAQILGVAAEDFVRRFARDGGGTHDRQAFAGLAGVESFKPGCA